MHIETCPRCNGKGKIEVCEKCHGLGFIPEIITNGQTTSYSTKKCDCNSAKIILENKCSECNGRGTITVSASRNYPKDYPIELIPIGAQR